MHVSGHTTHDNDITIQKMFRVTANMHLIGEHYTLNTVLDL